MSYDWLTFDFALEHGNTIHADIGNGYDWTQSADANFQYTTGHGTTLLMW